LIYQNEIQLVSDIKFFLNLVIDNINFVFTISDMENLNLLLFDTSGRKIFNEFANASGNKITYNLQSLPGGTYLLLLKNKQLKFYIKNSKKIIMNKLILLGMFMISASLFSQSLFFTTGKNDTDYDFKMSLNTQDKEFSSGSGNFYEVGYTTPINTKNTLRHSISINLNEYSSNSGDFLTQINA
jgi:hypothetical protein